MFETLKVHARTSMAVSVLALSMTTMSPALAEAPPQGELAAAIRSADLPCAHVIDVSAASGDVWLVTCNSGSFLVRKETDGGYAVSSRD
jgi:hypothetical protein